MKKNTGKQLSRRGFIQTAAAGLVWTALDSRGGPALFAAEADMQPLSTPHGLAMRDTLQPSPGPRHEIASGSRALATIVLPKKADQLEAYAAQEFQKYVKAITGVTLPVVREPQEPSGYGIWLGRTARVASCKFTLTGAQLGRDGYAAEAGPRGLVVVGRIPRGTLFGVYDIIEREFGVRWCEPNEGRLPDVLQKFVADDSSYAPIMYAYSKAAERFNGLGEVVPRADALSIGTFRREFRPSFDIRWVHEGDWSLKQRMNVQIEVENKLIGIGWKWDYHSFANLIPPSKYFDQHPDWFPLIDGKRQRSTKPDSHGTQLCTSNPEVVEKLAQRLIEELDRDPSIEIISFAPNDGGGFCQCPACRALDGPDRGWFGLYSNRLAVLNQQVAERVAKRHPKVLLKVGAGRFYMLPPSIPGYKAPANLIFVLAHNYCCHNHPIAAGQCIAGKTYQPNSMFMPNSKFAEVVKQWRAITPNIIAYEYYALHSWGGEAHLLWPLVHTMRYDIPWYRDMGIRGFQTQTRQAPWRLAPLNYYIAAKLAWNADLDVDWLIDDFCTRFFTRAAVPMRNYLLGLEKAMVAANICISSGSPPDVLGPRIFNYVTRERLRSYLDKAGQLADDQLVKRRIEAMRCGFDECDHRLAEDERKLQGSRASN